ncbi:tyrosine-type recombinase/integrase [Nocardia sp. CA-290969]|uniref:tyrosine-type recombinase/integrase n=1 Tax=Nocardia sp. CA-290969 TaxID=3239986 RepID=UPI003D90B140
MATVEPYETKSGKRYQVRYRKPDGKQTKKRGFRRKIDAEQFAATVEVKKMEGTYVAPALGRITVAELAPAWLDHKKTSVARSNYRTLESAWRIHVQPRWGEVRIADIDLPDVEAWISKLRKDEYSTTTVVRVHSVLAGILDSAVLKSKRLRVNPARGVDNLPAKSVKRHVYLTAEDVEKLANEAKHRVLVLVLGYCGLRWGEAIALRVRDIQFLRRRLAVTENAVQLSVEHDEKAPKSNAARSVPVPRFVLDELATHCEGRGRNDLVFGNGTDYLPRPKSGDGWFAGAVRRSGVQTITPHDLRHTCASLAVSSGANVLALARMLGHANPAITLKVYADLFDSDLDAVAEGIHNAYGPGRCAQNVPKTG